MKYGAILADPPWKYLTYSAKGTGRGAVSHYDVMTVEEIKAMPVADYAAKDCVLFLWVTDTHLPVAFDVLAAWGFAFKTVGFYWVKSLRKGTGYHFGMGHWTRANGELCLLATRGSPKRLARDVRRLMISPVREHSRKPDETRDRIMQLVDGPYLEMFARVTGPGWDCRGNQVGLFDAGGVKTRRQPSDLKGVQPHDE